MDRKYDLLDQWTDSYFTDRASLEHVIKWCGLGGMEMPHEFPEELRPHMGSGLQIWQYPRQLAPFLLHLRSRGIHSICEFGTSRGGLLAFTTNYFSRFGTVARAITCDLKRYPEIEKNVLPYGEFFLCRTNDPKWQKEVRSRQWDLIIIDASHRYEDVLADVELAVGNCRFLALHDVSNRQCPGVGKAWRHISATFKGIEFTEQYEGVDGPYLGWGLLELGV